MRLCEGARSRSTSSCTSFIEFHVGSECLIASPKFCVATQIIWSSMRSLLPVIASSTSFSDATMPAQYSQRVSSYAASESKLCCEWL